jgi:predicted Zn-dependent protease
MNMGHAMKDERLFCTRPWGGVIVGALLLIGLFLCAGCATNGRIAAVKAEETSAYGGEPMPAPQAAPSVVHFTDGREGFLITEQSEMGPECRAGFDEANILIRDGKYDPAVDLLETMTERWPHTTAPHINAAIAYRQMNMADQAELHLKKALELIPGHPVASNEYGLLLRKAGRFAESRQMYEKSLTLFPEYLPIRRNLGILCDIYLNDPACALKQYELYSKGMPHDEQVKMWIATLNARLGIPADGSNQPPQSDDGATATGSQH